ncbi:nucleoside phosphorylase domain-containing protein [Trichoderma afarasin]
MQSTSPRPSPNCGSDDLGSTLSTSHQVHTELPGHHRPINREEFKIAIICALPLEYDAVCLVFDEFWDEDGDPYGTAPGDVNTYTTGRIGDQNVVLALLHRMGKVGAASTIARMKASYTGLRQAFLVGICGGVPRTQNGTEIMLGDVILSKTIIQYDFGKRYPDRFVRKYTSTEVQSNDIQGFLVMAETMRGRNRLSQAASKFLTRLQENANRNGCGTKYAYPGLSKDELFKPSYRHKHHGSPNCVCKECHELTSPVCDEALIASCKELGCNSNFIVLRARPLNNQGQHQNTTIPDRVQMLAIHVGSIASGDTVMKSGIGRDMIAQKEGIIAFEMEAAGIWDEIPCLIIKGVSDYADSHKHNEWQDFAAATAAATVNALLIAQAEKDKARLEREALTSFLQSLNPDNRERALVFLRLVFGQQPRLMKQVLLSPALVIDARGRNLPFHLETISSKELFVYILKDRFKDIGTSKIDKGEWFLEDQNSKARLNLSKPWLSVIKVRFELTNMAVLLTCIL